jgi:pseudouridylate synthase
VSTSEPIGVVLDPEVGAALGAGQPVVALETTLVAHGFPSGQGAEVAAEAEYQVRTAGAIPATVGVLDGAVRVGLGAPDIERLADAGATVRKLGPRDLAACAVQGALGATTVGATLVACRAAGIRFFATGGIGGVHRGFPSPPDVSADLAELARSQVVVVCAGAKSLLDVPATAEALETLGVPVLGWRTDTLPLFYSARGGPPVAARVESADEAARIARLHWRLGGGALLVARAPEPGLEDVEDLIQRALAAAERDGAGGPALTPYALAFMHRESGGRTLAVNRELVVANAALAAELAVAYRALGP